MFLIFKGDDLHLAISNLLKNYRDNDDYTVVKCDDYDGNYNYSLVDGVAVKDEAIVMTLEQEAELQKTEYIDKRRSEYPKIAEQLDYIYHNGVEAWKSDIIEPIKAKYPKPIED